MPSSELVVPDWVAYLVIIAAIAGPIITAFVAFTAGRTARIALRELKVAERAFNLDRLPWVNFDKIFCNAHKGTLHIGLNTRNASRWPVQVHRLVLQIQKVYPVHGETVPGIVMHPNTLLQPGAVYSQLAMRVPLSDAEVNEGLQRPGVPFLLCDVLATVSTLGLDDSMRVWQGRAQIFVDRNPDPSADPMYMLMGWQISEVAAVEVARQESSAQRATDALRRAWKGGLLPGSR